MKDNVHSKKERRRFYRLVVSPKFQLKYSLYYVGLALTSMAVLNILMAYMLLNMIQIGSESPTAKISTVIMAAVLANKGIIGAGLAVLGFLYLYLAFILTRNIVGPVRVLVLHIEALKQGNYRHKTNLRKSDELKSLMNGLNELSDVLSERHGSPALDQKAADF